MFFRSILSVTIIMGGVLAPSTVQSEALVTDWLSKLNDLVTVGADLSIPDDLIDTRGISDDSGEWLTGLDSVVSVGLDDVVAFATVAGSSVDDVGTQTIVRVHQTAAVLANVIELGAGVPLGGNVITNFANSATGVVTVVQNTGHGAVVQQSVIVGGTKVSGL